MIARVGYASISAVIILQRAGRLSCRNVVKTLWFITSGSGKGFRTCIASQGEVAVRLCVKSVMAITNLMARCMGVETDRPVVISPRSAEFMMGGAGSS